MASYTTLLCHASPRKCIMDSSLRDRMPTMSSWDQPNRNSKDHSEYRETLVFVSSHLPYNVLSKVYESQIPDLKPQEVMQSKLLLIIIFWVNRGMSEPCPTHKLISGQGIWDVRKGKKTRLYDWIDPARVKPKKETSSVKICFAMPWERIFKSLSCGQDIWNSNLIGACGLIYIHFKCLKFSFNPLDLTVFNAVGLTALW